MPKSIASAKISSIRHRVAGRLVEGGTDKPVRFIQLKPVQNAFQRDFDRLDDDAWLPYALHAVDMLGKGHRHDLPMERREAAGSHERSGNTVVTALAGVPLPPTD